MNFHTYVCDYNVSIKNWGMFVCFSVNVIFTRRRHSIPSDLLISRMQARWNTNLDQVNKMLYWSRIKDFFDDGASLQCDYK